MHLRAQNDVSLSENLVEAQSQECIDANITFESAVI
jgi:hypothetical protein